MTEHIIFEESIEGIYYIKLESEHDSRMSLASVIGVKITEELGAASPILTVQLADSTGDLFAINTLSHVADYKFSIGYSLDDNITIPMNVSNFDMSNSSYGSPEDMYLNVDFMGSNWTKLLKDTHSRSWTGMKYSDVIQEIIEDSGYEVFDIDATDSPDHVIQPGWTNLQLIRYISEICTTEEEIPGYVFSSTIDKRFLFKSYNSLNEKKAKFNFIMGESEEEGKISFGQITVVHDYLPKLIHGGFGFNSVNYNFFTKEIVEHPILFSESNQAQLSDWSIIAEEHESPSRTFYGGRDTSTLISAETKLVSLVNNTQSIEIPIEGNYEIHVGDKVDIFIPPSQFSEQVVNEYYSGEWLVKKVEHEVSLKDRSFITRLTLIRAGLNGVSLDGYVTSLKGKV